MDGTTPIGNRSYHTIVYVYRNNDDDNEKKIRNRTEKKTSERSSTALCIYTSMNSRRLLYTYAIYMEWCVFFSLFFQLFVVVLVPHSFDGWSKRAHLQLTIHGENVFWFRKKYLFLLLHFKYFIDFIDFSIVKYIFFEVWMWFQWKFKILKIDKTIKHIKTNKFNGIKSPQFSHEIPFPSSWNWTTFAVICIN